MLYITVTETNIMSLLGFELGSPGLQIQHLPIELVGVLFKPDSTTLFPSKERVIFDSSRVPSPEGQSTAWRQSTSSARESLAGSYE